jgi:hypothetical protein
VGLASREEVGQQILLHRKGKTNAEGWGAVLTLPEKVVFSLLVQFQLFLLYPFPSPVSL